MLGGVWESIQIWMEKFTFYSDVRGYHVCKDVWKPAIGKILQFAVKVVKNNETVDQYDSKNFFGQLRF